MARTSKAHLGEVSRCLWLFLGHLLASQADQWKSDDVCGELRVEPEMKTESIVASNLIFHANAEQMWALLDAENMSR